MNPGEDGGCLLLKEEEVPAPITYPSDIGIRYDFETGLYKLWMTNDNTIMKSVYEDGIYILKGTAIGWDVDILPQFIIWETNAASVYRPLRFVPLDPLFVIFF